MTILFISIAIGVVLTVFAFNRGRIYQALVKKYFYIDLSDPTSSTIELYERSQRVSSMLSMQAYSLSKLNYDPAKTVFTGYVSGSNIIGEIHNVPDHYSVKRTGLTDRYSIVYGAAPFNERRIYEIVLTSDKLVKEAQNNPKIKKLMQGNKILLHHPELPAEEAEKYEVAEKRALAAKNRQLHYDIAVLREAGKHLSDEECGAIFFLACGKSKGK